MTYDLIQFKEYIEKKAGIKINDDEKLCFAIGEMIALNRLESETELFDLIVSKRDDFENLVGFLTINETYFFREPAQLDVFANTLIPVLLNKLHDRGSQQSMKVSPPHSNNFVDFHIKQKTGKINVLSAGCSTGAEPYSLAIALMEKFGRNIGHLFSVKGFDIDKQALKIANEGIYGKYFFRGLEESIIDKYFDKIADDKYKIKSFVKNIVDLYSHNLLHSPFPEIFHETHVVFYRNVSIYFEPANQKKIFINISNIMSEDGYLIMSSTETFPHDFRIMSLIKLDNTFLYQKKINEEASPKNQLETYKISSGIEYQTKSVNSLDLGGLKQSFKENSRDFIQKSSLVSSIHENCSPDTQIQKAWSLAQSKSYEESLIIIDKVINMNSAPVRAYTLKASILIKLNQLTDAKKICLKAFEIDEFCMESFFLLGIIARFENDIEDAEAKFKQAIYFDSSCWLAHYYLAEIYRARNEVAKSFRKYEIVIKLIEKSDATGSGLLFCGLLFSEKELIQACRCIMDKMRIRN